MILSNLQKTNHCTSNPWVNPAWLHTELIKIFKTKVKEEKQRAGEYSKKNLEAAEKITELQQNLKDQADSIRKADI